MRKPKVVHRQTEKERRRDPWRSLREKPGVTIKSTARREP